jgi:hypothetical protein
MTDRVYEDVNNFEVLDKHGDCELIIHMDRSVNVKVSDDSQYAVFNMTAEEATMMKEFLITRGY